MVERGPEAAQRPSAAVGTYRSIRSWQRRLIIARAGLRERLRAGGSMSRPAARPYRYASELGSALRKTSAKRALSALWAWRHAKRKSTTRADAARDRVVMCDAVERQFNNASLRSHPAPQPDRQITEPNLTRRFTLRSRAEFDGYARIIDNRP